MAITNKDYLPDADIPLEFSVGSIVRIPRGGNDKKTGKATILTIDDDEEVSLLWEDAAPASIQGGFLVRPRLPSSKDDDEISLSKSLLQHLQQFETAQLDGASPTALKDHGDTLLKLGDASSAIPYYELALQMTSKVQIGSTVLIAKSSDVILAAEVDCMEDDTADLTFIESGEETVAKVKSIRLAISLKQSDLQLRLLLNLARCLLQLADFDNSPLSRPSSYRQGAVLACSLAWALLQQNEEDITPFHISSLILRSKAQAGRAKWQPALNDIDQVLKYKPQSKEGRKWRKDLQGLIAQQDLANKKLVKGMCQWIQTATNEGEDVVSEDATTSKTVENDTCADSSSWSRDWIFAVIVVVVALWLYRSQSKVTEEDIIW